MKSYTISEKLALRDMPKEAVTKIIDFYIRRFFEKFSIDGSKRFYWESYYIFDKYYKGEFKNTKDFQKYLQKSYTQYLNHSEINCV